jgi:hypothetical protein
MIAFKIPSEVVKAYVLQQIEAGSRDLSPRLKQVRWNEYCLPDSDSVDEVYFGPNVDQGSESAADDDEGDDPEVEVKAGFAGPSGGAAGTIYSHIRAAKKRIADLIGTTPDRVKISVDFA